MPWPRLKISRPLREVRQHVVDRAVERGAARDQRQRIEIALDGDAALHALADEGGLGGPVDADGIDAGRIDIGRQQRAGAAGKADDLRVRHSRLRTPSTMRAVGSTDQRANSRGGSTPAQVSKICKASAPASNWPSRYSIEFSTSMSMIFAKASRMPIGHHPRRRLVRRALARDHVGRDRPRRAAEADQRDLRIELAAHAAQRLDTPARACAKSACAASDATFVRRIQRIEPRPFAGLEAHAAAERVGDHQDVGEDDRGIEAEPADRLQRDLGGELRA